MSEYPSNFPTVEHIMEVTAFKKRDRAEAALETLYWLSQDAPYTFNGFKDKFVFDMVTSVDTGRYLENDNSFYGNECGTACCIAGAIYSHVRRKQKKKIDQENFSIDKYFGKKIEKDYSELDDDLWRLFYIHDDADLETITAKQAYKTLLGYLKTGIVTWKLRKNQMEPF